MYSIQATEEELENYTEDFESIINFSTFREKFETNEFEKAFYIHFNGQEFSDDLNKENEYDLANMIYSKSRKDTNSTQIFDNKKINYKNEYNLLGKKTEIDNTKFKVKKINPKREITFITFNTKLNKYLTKKINQKISETCQLTKNFFTDENPLLSTKLTQCGIQKTLKSYLYRPIKDFIKEENMNKIKEFGLENEPFFDFTLYECIFQYYEFIYSDNKEFQKYSCDKKFVIRNDKFSKNGLINLKYGQNHEKIYGYLDFLDKNRDKKNHCRFRFSIKNKA